MTDYLDDERARLEMNARGHHYDAGLERVADLFNTDRQAWNALPRQVQSVSSVYRDLRDHYRRAVKAGAVPDSRGPQPTT